MEHSDVPAGYIHLPFQWLYADASARTSATGFAAGDVYKLALELDTDTAYLLTAVDGSGDPTWETFGSGTVTKAGVIATGVLATDLEGVAASALGANSGVATLDSGGDVPLGQLGNVPGTSLNGSDGSINAKTYSVHVSGRRLGYVTASATTTAVSVGNGQTPFSAGDVGKHIIVFSDTAAGVPGTIATVVDSSHITVSVTGGLALAGASTGCFMIYGDDDTTAINAAATAAAGLVQSDLTLGANESIGLGQARVRVVAAAPGSCAVVTGQIVIPPGVVLDSDAVIANLQTSTTNPVISFGPYSGFTKLRVDACFGAGIRMGPVSATGQADCNSGQYFAWHVGKATGQVALALVGNSHVIDSVWVKGGFNTITHNVGGDCTINRAFCIGAVQPILMTSSNQVAYGKIIFDSCGQNGGGTSGLTMDNAVSDITFDLQAFEVTGISPVRTLDNVVLLGNGSTNKNVDIRGKINAQLTGGNVLNLQQAQDVMFDIVGSNTATPSSGGSNITTGVVWGTVAGAVDIRAAYSGSITPSSGTIGGRYTYEAGGVTTIADQSVVLLATPAANDNSLKLSSTAYSDRAATNVKGLPLGLTGATAATRFVGATASGAPTSGTFLKGDWIVDQTGTFWVCTTAGTPGTWTQPTGGGSSSSYQPLGSIGATETLTLTTQITQATATLTANCALTIASLTALCFGVLELVQDGTGGHTLTVNGQTVIIPTAASTPFVVLFWSPDGTNLWVLPAPQKGDTGATGSAGAGYGSTTSTTSLAIGTGSKAFTVSSVGAYVVGEQVRVIDTATPTNWMEGNITAIAGSVITVNVTNTNGSGTFATWQFAAAGVVGPTGSTGPTGTSLTVPTDITSSATPSIAISTPITQQNITALTVPITGVTITGTPLNGYVLRLRIHAATALAITLGSSFTADAGVTLLSTTIATKTLMTEFIYDASISKFVQFAAGGGY